MQVGCFVDSDIRLKACAIVRFSVGVEYFAYDRTYRPGVFGIDESFRSHVFSFGCLSDEYYLHIGFQAVNKHFRCTGSGSACDDINDGQIQIDSALQELGVQYQVTVLGALLIIILQESKRAFQFIGRYKDICEKLHAFHFSTGIIAEVEYKIINAALLAFLGEST